MGVCGGEGRPVMSCSDRLEPSKPLLSLGGRWCLRNGTGKLFEKGQIVTISHLGTIWSLLQPLKSADAAGQPPWTDPETHGQAVPVKPYL